MSDTGWQRLAVLRDHLQPTSEHLRRSGLQRTAAKAEELGSKLVTAHEAVAAVPNGATITVRPQLAVVF